MARNRRNKRNFKKLTEMISFKTFLILLAMLTTVILICLGTIFYRNELDRQMLAKQRKELDEKIESIFSDTLQNIAQSNKNKPDSVIRLSAVGDILCDTEILEDGKHSESKTYSYDYLFQNITGFIERSDIVLGTMETNFVDKPYSGYGVRNAPIEFAQAVKNSGINLVSISTNHSLDYGMQGLYETKNHLQSLGFSTVGDRLEEETVTIKTVKNTKIAFLSYTYGVENQNKKTKEELQALNIYDREIAKKELQYAKENADYIFVIMHWGDPYATKQSKNQEEIAEFLIENGANVILGNHSAAIQPMEIRQNSEGENVFIAYSLGNYISYADNENSKVELVLNIELRKSGEDGKVRLSKVDYTPIYVLDKGSGTQNRFELIDMKGVAKEYAGGNTNIVNKKTYNKLLEGLKLLEKVVEKGKDD